MWSRGERETLIRLGAAFDAHARACAEDKGEVKKRLDDQDEISAKRHAENVGNLQRFERKVTWGIISLLLAVLGFILSQAIHFKIALGGG